MLIFKILLIKSLKLTAHAPANKSDISHINHNTHVSCTWGSYFPLPPATKNFHNPISFFIGKKRFH